MWYRDTTENDIRRGVEAFIATENLLRLMGQYKEIDLAFDPDCCLTYVHPWNDSHSSICTIEPEEDGAGYEVTRHGESKFKYTATSAAVAAVQMVIEWRVRHLEPWQADAESVEEMVMSIIGFDDSMSDEQERQHERRQMGLVD